MIASKYRLSHFVTKLMILLIKHNSTMDFVFGYIKDTFFVIGVLLELPLYYI